MKRAIHNLVVLLLLTTLLSGTVFSQQTTATIDKQAEEALREKAFNLLESLAREIGSLQSGENRARMGSNIAGSLWIHNQTKAREIFALVIDDIKAGLQVDEKDPDRDRTFMVFLKLREDTIERIAKHDPELALAFLKDSKPTSRKVDPHLDSALYMRLAKQVTATNPDLALKLGRQSLKDGVSQEQVEVLRKLAKKSPDQASIFYREIVEKVRDSDVLNDWRVQQFAQLLAQQFTPRAADESSFRDFLTFLIDAAQKNGCGQKDLQDSRVRFCYQIGTIIPLMEKIDPSRVASMKRFAPTEFWSPDPEEIGAAVQGGSADDLLALIPQYPERGEMLQYMAIRKLMGSGDFDRARKLANEFIGTQERKEDILTQLERAQRTRDEDTSPALLRRANELDSVEEKLNFLYANTFRLASVSPKTTLKLLDHAYEILATLPPGKLQMQYQIGIAATYCKVKNDRCFTMMEPLVQNLNDLVLAATKLNGFDNRYLRNGEWNMTAEGGVGSLLTMLAKNAGFFARYDFDRAVTLSAQFERPEIRMMAQLKLAQGMLDGPPKDEFFYYYEY